MFKIKKIDHVAIAVDDIDRAVGHYRDLFGLETSVRECVPSQDTDAALLPIGDTHLELIEPKGNEGLRKFLDRRGPGLHHIAIEVEGIE
jgi:methylmalonyl-CoA/ethylmalonyl-CoA epimerase